MPVWPVADDPGEAPVVLTDWALFELPSGARHIAGYVPRERGGRVTSAVVALDVATLRATTDSGRAYRLARQGWGLNLDAEYAWNAWQSRNGVTGYRDLTRDIIEQHDAQAK